MKRTGTYFAGLLASLLVGGPVLAAASPARTLQLHTVAQTERTVTNEKGETRTVLVEAAKVTPGDEVIYTVHYKNTGSAPADEVVITNPVPQHTTCVAVPKGEHLRVTVSVDGGKTFNLLQNLTVRGADHQPRPATYADCTHIRWMLLQPLAPGASGEVSFRSVLQ